MPKEWEGEDVGGHEAGTIFVDTDYKFSILRITTLIERYLRKKFSNTEKVPDSVAVEMFVKNCLQRLHVMRCSSSEQLVVSLQNLENLVCSDPKISIVMIDSISAFYWIDKFNGGESTVAQEGNMKLISSILGKLVNTYNLVLFATKAQIYKKKGHDSVTSNSKDADSLMKRDLEEEHAEFMCKAWQRLVSHRLICVQGTNQAGDQPVYVVGGDAAQGNRGFTVQDSGMEFENVGH